MATSSAILGALATSLSKMVTIYFQDLTQYKVSLIVSAVTGLSLALLQLTFLNKVMANYN